MNESFIVFSFSGTVILGEWFFSTMFTKVMIKIFGNIQYEFKYLIMRQKMPCEDGGHFPNYKVEILPLIGSSKRASSNKIADF